MLEVRDLTRRYGDVAAVSDLSFDARPGEILGLIGPNGAGKTTILRCLAGILPPTSGSIRIRGHDLLARPVEAKRALGFVADEPRLFDYLTVSEHLDLTARIYQTSGAAQRRAALLDELGLAGRLHLLPAELSRGMKQKLVLACALLHEPQVLLLDEPLTGLDPAGIRKVKDAVLRRARDGAAVIVSSHMLHLVEEVCDRLLLLQAGRPVLHASMDEIRRRVPQTGSRTSLEEIFLRVTATAGE